MAVGAGVGFGVVERAVAQFRVDVAGIGLTQRPFAIAPFRGRSTQATAFDDIVTADLERSGLFRAVPVASDALDETALPDLAPWRARGVDAPRPHKHQRRHPLRLIQSHAQCAGATQ